MRPGTESLGLVRRRTGLSVRQGTIGRNESEPIELREFTRSPTCSSSGKAHAPARDSASTREGPPESERMACRQREQRRNRGGLVASSREVTRAERNRREGDGSREVGGGHSTGETG